jgi:hypothetical protein
MIVAIKLSRTTSSSTALLESRSLFAVACVHVTSNHQKIAPSVFNHFNITPPHRSANARDINESHPIVSHFAISASCSPRTQPIKYQYKLSKSQ